MPAFSATVGFYFLSLYPQLKAAFKEQNQFVPTRFYSDVCRITPRQSRSTIEARLKNLNYTFRATKDEMIFTLHSLDYPADLIPVGHPTLDHFYRIQPVTLHFSGSSPDSTLQSIHLGKSEISDLYLEPELIATLSKGGDTSKVEIRDPLKFNDIPKLVWKAVISIEDQHFFEHNGIDPKGIARAIWVDIQTQSFAQGGSTITQQLVKNLMERRGKDLVEKVNEAFLALLLEGSFSKEQILERYLNEVYLGQVGKMEVHGVAEGAHYFFGKDLKDLNLGEVALMAALIRGPSYYSPYRYQERAFERQRLVLKKMVETGHITQSEANLALKMPIRLAPPQTVANKAPYFTDFVKAQLIDEFNGRMNEEDLAQSGFRVYTTLDTRLNSLAQNSVNTGIGELENRLSGSSKTKAETLEYLEGVLASVDQSTGYIRALIGGRSYSKSTFNRILNMKRQVGSTFKPLVYLTALQKGVDPHGVPYSPAHPIEDAPWTLVYDHGRQNWSPRNYEKTHQGWMSYRKALAHSVNTATAKLGWEVGIDSIIQTARALGIQSDLPAVPSLSLGVAELSPIELLNAYVIFSNHGLQNQLTVIRAITDRGGTQQTRAISQPTQVIQPATADLLTDMLESVFSEGTAHRAMESMKNGFDRPAAGKTGTTSNYRDAWFAGYTPQLTTVVWVGTDQNAQQKPSSLIKLTGASSALPIWLRFMKEALDGEQPLPFSTSPEIIELPVDQRTGMRATEDCAAEQVSTDKFLKEFEPSETSCEATWPASVNQAEGP